MDGAGTKNNTHAIYLTGNNKLNLQDGSVLTVKNYKQDALEWDGGDGGYNLNVTGGSKLVSDHNRSGLTGTFYATVDASTVDVINSTGNGSNGSHFDIRNGSSVTFSGNADHGLSAGNLSISNSTVTAENNGRNGIIFTGKGAFKAATVNVSGTKGKSYWNAGIRLFKANAALTVDAASKVSITDNQVTGLFLDGGASATFADGAALTVTGNDASQANCATEKDLARRGGGIVVREGASLVLPAVAQVNNNRATLAGDDVYVEEGGSLTFSAANSGVKLSAFDGCDHAIDGWYDDSLAPDPPKRCREEPRGARRRRRACGVGDSRPPASTTPTWVTPPSRPSCPPPSPAWPPTRLSLPPSSRPLMAGPSTAGTSMRPAVPSGLTAPSSVPA